MTEGLYLLRCKQMGFSLSELDDLEEGFVYDVITEGENDDFEYPYKATQSDFDRFIM